MTTDLIYAAYFGFAVCLLTEAVLDLAITRYARRKRKEAGK